MFSLFFFLVCKDGNIRLVDGVIHETNTSIFLLNTVYDATRFCRYIITFNEEIFEEKCASSWTNVLRGRVEICRSNEYQSVCDDGWDLYEAQVVCRQLQHPSTGILCHNL